MIKVLLAEDEATTSRLLVNMLKNMGFIPIVCTEGSTAWKVLQANPDIELIITDMQMPEMDGRALIKHVKEDERICQIPIIIISGIVKLSEISDLLESGATYFLPKPVDQKDFAQYISKILN